MDTNQPGATPVAENSASTASTNSAPPAAQRPRTIADFVKTASDSLRSSAANPDPVKRDQQKPQAPEAKESPAPDPTAESPDLSQSNEASTAEQTEVAVESEDPVATPDADEEHSESKWPKGAIERTKKLKAQRNELRKQIEALTAQNRELQAKSNLGGIPQQDAHDHFSGAQTPEAIQQIADQARNVTRQLQSLIEDIADDPDSVASQIKKFGVQLEDYSPESMRKYLRRIRDNAASTVDQAPERLRQIEQRKQYSEMVRKTVPDLTDEDSELSQIVSQARQAYPGLQQRPDADLQYAIYALGWKAFQSMTQQGQKPAAKPAPTKPLPKAPASIPSPKSSLPPPPDRDELGEAAKQMRSSKGLDGVMKYASAAVRRASAGA